MKRGVFASFLVTAGLSATLPATEVRAAVLPAAVPARKSVLPFIEDDYPRALAEARAKKRPIFVEAWAPW